MMPSAKSNQVDDLVKLRRSPHAMASWQNALHCLSNGRHAPAFAGFYSLAQQFPGIPQLWAELGVAAAGNLDFTAADQFFQRALELAPTDAALLTAIGAQYYNLRRMDQVLDCFERAVAADLSSVNLRLTLAAWLERCRRLDEALECIQSCLAQHPRESQAIYFKAFLLHRNGRNSEAEAILRDLLKSNPLPPVEIQADAHHLLGLILDASGQYAGALSCLVKSKTLRSQTINLAGYDKAAEAGNQARRELLAELAPETLRRWREEAADSPSPHPLALLGGAMRSGTTLIEQILGAHPDILIFDESMNSLNELLAPLRSGLTAKTLNDLAPGSRSQMSGRYFKSLLRETDEAPGARLFLDKNPSATAWLHVWLRIFPQSKVIIALRDPRDVIISCYFQNFPKEWAIAGFSSLERTAKFYSDCMDVWLRMRELGGFDWIESRYENVVGNLETEGKRVTNFLGLPWHETQATYHETTERKFVHSPTYNEVKKPVHNRAVGRWEHYAEALAPLQSTVEPYLRAFGYR